MKYNNMYKWFERLIENSCYKNKDKIVYDSHAV